VSGPSLERRSTAAHLFCRFQTFVRSLVDDSSADIVLCPQLPDEVERAARESDRATAESKDLRSRTFELRVDVAHRLRALGMGTETSVIWSASLSIACGRSAAMEGPQLPAPSRGRAPLPDRRNDELGERSKHELVKMRDSECRISVLRRIEQTHRDEFGASRRDLR
jgi:hypothetical protein